MSWKDVNYLGVSLLVRHLSHTTKLWSKCKSFISHSMNIYITSLENVNSLRVSLLVCHLSQSVYITHILRRRYIFTYMLNTQIIWFTHVTHTCIVSWKYTCQSSECLSSRSHLLYSVYIHIYYAVAYVHICLSPTSLIVEGCMSWIWVSLVSSAPITQYMYIFNLYITNGVATIGRLLKIIGLFCKM